MEQRLGLFSPNQLKEDLSLYLKDLHQFLTANQILQLLRNPIDHFAVKAYDHQDYQRYLESTRPFTTSLSAVTMDNRSIATAILSNPLILRAGVICAVLEIMEPKPEKVGKDLVGIDHCEIFVPNLEDTEAQLTTLRLPFKHYQNPYHQAAVLQINDYGQEVKFTDNRLADINKQQIKNGDSYLI